MMATAGGLRSISEIVDELRRHLVPFFEESSSEVLIKVLQQKATECVPTTSIQQYISGVLLPYIVQALNKIVLLLEDGEHSVPGVPLLSVQNLRLLYTTIELLWICGISNKVQQQAKFTLPLTGHPNSLLIPKKIMDNLAVLSPEDCSFPELYSRIECIRAAVCNETLSGLMLQRNLDRILLTYYTLSNPEVGTLMQGGTDVAAGGTDTLSLSDASSNRLSDLIEGPFAAMIVTKLRGFTKGPPWLRDAALVSLTHILQSDGGLEVVLSGYLEGTVS